MLSGMYSYFYPSAPPTRFEACHELTRVRQILLKLRNKEVELQKSMEASGVGSLDYQKHSILHHLLTNMDATIAQFNQIPEPAMATRNQRLQHILQLVDGLRQHIQHTLDDHIRTLNIERNNNKVIAKTTVSATATVGTVAALYMAPITFIFKPFLLFGALDFKNAVISKTGMFTQGTKSMMLLTSLGAELNNAHDNLQLVLNPDRENRPRRNNNRAANNRNRPNAEDRLQELYILFSYSQPMVEYLQSFDDKESLSDKLDKIELTSADEAKLEPFLDPVLFSIPNRPVFLEGRIFDLDGLLAIRTQPNGGRKNPFTNTEFFKRDLQPARDRYNELVALVDAIIAEHRPAQLAANR